MDWEEWEERYGIDADELTELVEELIAQAEVEHEPNFRATIRGGRLWLSQWEAGMDGLPDPQHRPVPPDVAIADLTVAEVEGEKPRRELIARFIYQSEEGDDEGTLIDWASRTGYSLLWLPDRLVTLEVDPDRLGLASSECTICGAEWAADDPAFWAGVLERGFFPDTCGCCGCALPEWRS